MDMQVEPSCVVLVLLPCTLSTDHMIIYLLLNHISYICTNYNFVVLIFDALYIYSIGMMVYKSMISQ